MSKHWFIPKRFGWGFVPVSVEGWLMTLVLIGVIILISWKNSFFTETGPTGWQALYFLIDTAIATAIFSFIAAKKTKGKLKWRWGKRDD